MTPTQDAAALADELAAIAGRCSIEADRYTIIKAVGALRAPIQPVEVDWKSDPSADERWNAGCDFAMMQLCGAIGVDPKSVSWDAATETVDGDVCAVIGNIMRAKYGEDWKASPPSQPALRAAMEAIESVFDELCIKFSGVHQDDAIDSMLLRFLHAKKCLATVPAPAEDVRAAVIEKTPTEGMVLAGADVLLDACSSPNGQLHPWKPFDVAQIAIKVYAAMRVLTNNRGEPFVVSRPSGDDL